MGRKKKTNDDEIIEVETTVETEDSVEPENLENIEEPVVEQEPIIEEEIKQMEQTGPVTVNIKLDKHSVNVDYIIAATKQTEKVIAANNEIKLMHNRFYFIPVDCDSAVDSDSFGYMKIFSDVANYIDVRYVKDGVACVMPLTHNVTLKHGQRLCALW